MPFVVGDSYTRKDIHDILGIPQKDRGGKWNTGYTKHDGEIYIFCNVGIPGRTGHDYENRWHDNELVWFGKNGSRLNQPLIREMLSPSTSIHVFWRNQQYSPFIYAGCPDYFYDAKDTSPVEVRWGFGDYPIPQKAASTIKPLNKINSQTDHLSKALLRMASAIVQRITASGQISTVRQPLRTGPHFTQLVAALRMLWERQHGICALCGRAIPVLPTNRLLQMSPDRIDSLAKTYLASNVHIVHLGCNLAKSDASLPEWGEFLEILRDPARA